MTSSFHSRLIASLKAFSQIAGIGVILGGCLVLLGWGLNAELLKGGAPGMLAMNPGTALLFLLSGAALVLQMERLRPSIRRAGQDLAAALVVAALASVPGSVLQWDYSWDRLLFHHNLGDNRIAPNTALNFLLTGLALFLLNAPLRAGRRITQSLALAAAFICLLTILGYAYREASLSGVGAYIRMALNTALLCGLLCAGILCAHPEQG